jgi:hypothetical protein
MEREKTEMEKKKRKEEKKEKETERGKELIKREGMRKCLARLSTEIFLSDMHAKAKDRKESENNFNKKGKS